MKINGLLLSWMIYIFAEVTSFSKKYTKYPACKYIAYRNYRNQITLLKSSLLFDAQHALGIKIIYFSMLPLSMTLILKYYTSYNI